MMTEREALFYNKVSEKLHCPIRKIYNEGMPDFIVNEEFYVEVKNADCNILGISSLSSCQEKGFKDLDKPVIIAMVSLKNKSIELKDFEPKTEEEIVGTKSITIELSSEEYKNITELKNDLTWKQFFIYLLENKSRWDII